MSDYKYKMVNGELVELTAEEIAEFEGGPSDQAPFDEPPPIPDETRETLSAKRRPKRK